MEVDERVVVGVVKLVREVQVFFRAEPVKKFPPVGHAVEVGVNGQKAGVGFEDVVVAGGFERPGEKGGVNGVGAEQREVQRSVGVYDGVRQGEGTVGRDRDAGKDSGVGVRK